jgi:hypothetical protein
MPIEASTNLGDAMKDSRKPAAPTTGRDPHWKALMGRPNGKHPKGNRRDRTRSDQRRNAIRHATY